MKTKGISKINTSYKKLLTAQKRWELIKIINNNPGISILEIYTSMKLIDHSTASQHVIELEEIGWVQKKKIGKIQTCYITDNCIKDFKSINKFLNIKDKRFFW